MRCIPHGGARFGADGARLSAISAAPSSICERLGDDEARRRLANSATETTGPDCVPTTEY